MSEYNNLTSAEKLRLTELVLPQLEEMLAIARKLAADLINNGTIENDYRQIYSRDRNTYCQYDRLHLDKPNPSYKFIEIGYEWPTPIYCKHFTLQYLNWEKDGVTYFIKWDMDPKGTKWVTITKKFLFFRWNENVLRRVRKVTLFEFETRHNGDVLRFEMDECELGSMAVAAHDTLCNALAALKYQYENVAKCISDASTRKEIDDRKNTIRHFENLLEQSGNTKSTTSNLAKQ